jgi:hypothetical protein
MPELDKDIAKILTDWPHGIGSNVRCIVGSDGLEKIQIRVCIDSFHGLLQFECDGRPDGQRPHEKEFYLDHLEEKRRLLLAGSAPATAFRLTKRQCQKLFEESSMVYHRYVLLLQLGDYNRVIRDTSRNMRLFRFVWEHAQDAKDRSHLECWWPYILRIHFTAIAMQHLSEGRIDASLEAIETCRKRLASLEPMENETFKHEYTRSLEALTQMDKEIRNRKPMSESEKLQADLKQAIAEERYEDASKLRDMIKNADSSKNAPPAPEEPPRLA